MGAFGREFASWFLYNLDTDDQIEGQFPPEDVNHEMGAVFAESTALNRQHAISQFVHGAAETLSFTARLFAEDESVDLVRPLRMLQSWTKRDSQLMRPPILHFWIGDATVKVDQCLLESVSPFTYHSFRNDGSPRDITFTINLREYTEYQLVVDAGGETRYHRAKDHDYYEWITQREYGDPMLGVVIRNRHPTKPDLEIGEIVKLPSAEVMRGIAPKPTSIALQTAFGRKDTAQRRLKESTFDRLNLTHTSHIMG